MCLCHVPYHVLKLTMDMQSELYSEWCLIIIVQMSTRVRAIQRTVLCFYLFQSRFAQSGSRTIFTCPFGLKNRATLFPNQNLSPQTVSQVRALFYMLQAASSQLEVCSTCTETVKFLHIGLLGIQQTEIAHDNKDIYNMYIMYIYIRIDIDIYIQNIITILLRCTSFNVIQVLYSVRNCAFSGNAKLLDQNKDDKISFKTVPKILHPLGRPSSLQQAVAQTAQ